MQRGEGRDGVWAPVAGLRVGLSLGTAQARFYSKTKHVVSPFESFRTGVRLPSPPPKKQKPFWAFCFFEWDEIGEARASVPDRIGREFRHDVETGSEMGVDGARSGRPSESDRLPSPCEIFTSRIFFD